MTAQQRVYTPRLWYLIVLIGKNKLDFDLDVSFNNGRIYKHRQNGMLVIRNLGQAIWILTTDDDHC